jgi:hypothetical protein
VCHTATPSPTCDQREESLRRPEEGGTAGDLGIELILLLVEQVSFLTMSIQIFARLLGVSGSFTSILFKYALLVVTRDSFLI